jgi:hypothetical protein
MDRVAVALTGVAAAGAKGVRWIEVGRETQPVEIIENRALVFGPAPLAIVIFDAEQHARAMLARERPHKMGVQDVAEVEIAGRGRGEASECHFTIFAPFTSLF